MRSFLLLTTLLAPLALAACGGADASPAARTSATPAASAPADPALLAQCEAFFARARTCTEQYIPTLVDLRISLDKPAGITAWAQRPGGRDEIVQQALAEWADDSQPAAVAALCSKVTAEIPADQLAPMRAAGERCMAMTDCGAFSTCAVELNRPRIAAQP